MVVSSATVGSRADGQLKNRRFIERELHFKFQAITREVQKGILRGRSESLSLDGSAFGAQRLQFGGWFDDEMIIRVQIALFWQAQQTGPSRRASNLSLAALL